MPEFLFCFGYESPAELHQNELHGTDFESSQAIWIDASDENAALNWGCEIAERFYAQLCNRSWREDEYAYWLESLPVVEPQIQHVKVGEFPHFSDW